jgi:hypothetical protein
VVAELARDAQPLLAAEMNVDRRCRQHIENDELRRKKVSYISPRSPVI